MKRLSGELEKAENRNQVLNDKNKNLLKEIENIKANFEKERQTYEVSIIQMLQGSNEILIQLKNSLEVDLTDDTLKDDVFKKLKQEIKELNKNEDWKWLSEIRSNFGKILTYYSEIIYKHIETENNNQMQRAKWSQTLDQLTLSHDEELNKSNLALILEQHAIDKLKEKEKQLLQKIGQLEQEKYNIALLKDKTIDMLNKELNKGVNMHYLKNVILSFLTTKEESV
jgi:hypothetical protein